MPRVEAIPFDNPERSVPVLFEHALVARTMLQRVWSPKTACEGIELHTDDMPSRGQSGVSSLWLARHLVDQGVDAKFIEGMIDLPSQNEDHVWVEVHGLTSEPLVVDLTSDQYRNPHGTRVHLGMYGDSPVGSYQPVDRHEPYDVKRRKLLARYALLKDSIVALPARHRIQVIRSTTSSHQPSCCRPSKIATGL